MLDEDVGFEWDPFKEGENIEKHGVDFLTATRAFDYPYRKVSFDDRHSQHEDRFFCVGMVMGEILTVRFVRRENKIRIIGAGFWRKGAMYYEKEEDNR